MPRKKTRSDEKPRTPHAAFGRDEAFLNRAPRRFRDQIAELRQREQGKIAEGLRSAEVRELFLRDPAAALERLGVEMPSDLRKRLRRVKGLPDLHSLLEPAPIRLPNGKTVTPRIRIRITAGEGR